MFAPDPGAPEQSQVGGNIATNAGGPHAFKYGVVGEWVTGIEAAIPPGELVAIGGPIRKDVAGYDLKRLLIGSEGTLGIVTAAWLKLLPAPEAVLPVAIFYRGGRGVRRAARVRRQRDRRDGARVLDGETLACGARRSPAAARGRRVPADGRGRRIAGRGGARARGDRRGRRRGRGRRLRAE